MPSKKHSNVSGRSRKSKIRQLVPSIQGYVKEKYTHPCGGDCIPCEKQMARFTCLFSQTNLKQPSKKRLNTKSCISDRSRKEKKSESTGVVSIEKEIKSPSRGRLFLFPLNAKAQWSVLGPHPKKTGSMLFVKV